MTVIGWIVLGLICWGVLALADLIVVARVIKAGDDPKAQVAYDP